MLLAINTFPPQIFFTRPDLSNFHLISHLIVSVLTRPHALTSYSPDPRHAWGFREGASRPLAMSNARLRINSILNSVTRRGTFLGNSAGVLGMVIHPITILFVLHSALALQLWDTMELIPPSTRFGASMTLSEVCSQVVSPALSSSPPVSAFPTLSQAHDPQGSTSFLAGVKPALAAATIVSASAGAWSWIKTRV